MGSSGSGSFTDYSGRKPSDPKGGSGNSGGGSGQDKCLRAFSASLEDVGLYPFYATTGTVPAIGTTVSVVQAQRLVAIDQNGLEIGALPTALNYIAGCLQDGYSYTGVVSSSSATPVPRVDVDFAPV